MTQRELKELTNLGAELGAAKAEMERLRGLLREAVHCCPDEQLRNEMRAALSQQPETTDTYTSVDMATAAAKAFRDGQAAVEPAPAQGERKTFEVEIPDISAIYDGRSFIPYRSLEAGDRLMTVAQHLRIEKQLRAALTRPAQTEQQHPDDAAVDRFAAAMKAKLAAARAKGRGGWDDPNVCSVEFLAQLLVEHLAKGNAGTFEDVANFAMMLHQRGAEPKVLADAAPVVQTAPQGKFRMGDLVKKSTGSEWVGHVCGTYSTELTPEGYAVESAAHKGSVQIYPAKALELVPMAAKEA